MKPSKIKIINYLRTFVLICLIAGAVSSSILYYFVSTQDGPEEIRFLTEEELASVQGIQSVKPVEENLLIDIAGQIKKPGVIEISEGMSLFEVIEKAGGFTQDADMYYVQKNLNLSEIVTDRQKIYIPSIVERQETSNVASSNSSLININESTLEELDSLPGIGLSTAEKIIQNRPYNSIEDIKNVSGIGESTFEKFKDRIRV